MGVNFKVAMILEAVNNMNPGIRRAMDSVNRLRNRITSTARETARINPVRGWEDKIAQASKRMEEFGRKAESVRKQAEKLMTSGIKDLVSGAGIGVSVLKPVKRAANAQTKYTTMETMGVSKEQIGKVKENTLRLSAGLTFDYSQVQDIALALNKAGVNGDNLLKMQELATKYAQLEYYRYGADPGQTATHFAHIAETAGVLYATKDEKAKYGLDSQDKIDSFVMKKTRDMTEYLNRVVSATSSDTATYAEALKYSMPEARMEGLTDQFTMLMTGVFSRAGIEGSMSGTHLKDFAKRLNPYQHFIDEDEGKRSNRLSAMQAAGWLEGAQWTVSKRGKKIFTSAGKSVFHNDDGSLKSPEFILSKMYESFQKFQSEGKTLQFKGILNDVLQEQGGTFARLFLNDPEMFERIQTDMGKVMSIDDSLARRLKDANAQWDIFSGNVKTTSLMMGDLLLDDITPLLKKANDSLFGGSGKNQKSPARQWIEDHKELISWIMKSALVFAGLTMGMGILKIAAAGLKFALVSPLMTGVGWMGKLLKGAVNLKTGFDLVRATGAGFGKSIVKGAELAWPWLEKLNGWVGKFTPFWLRNAARIAAGWLIAMGPVGWIIAGVTAIIIAAVWAWETNFMGFRDKCSAVWDWIKDYVEFILPGISTKISNHIRDAKAYWEDLKQRIGEKWDEIKTYAGNALSGMCGMVKEACNAMGIDFDGLAEKAKSAFQALWDAQPGVQAYKAVQKHFNDFEAFRAQKHPAEGFRAIRGEGMSYAQPQKPNLTPLSFASQRIVEKQSVKVIPITYLQERKANEFMPPNPRADMRAQTDQPQPYIVQPIHYGNQAHSFQQTNNIKVNSNKEAAEFARQAVPDKYKSASNNPSNYAGIPRGETGEAV